MLTAAKSLSSSQYAAIFAAGLAVYKGWAKSCPEVEYDPDYDFSGEGDWQAIRAAAQSVGIDWTGTQPDTEYYQAVWQAAQDGYRSHGWLST